MFHVCLHEQIQVGSTFSVQFTWTNTGLEYFLAQALAQGLRSSIFLFIFPGILGLRGLVFFQHFFVYSMGFQNPGVLGHHGFHNLRTLWLGASENLVASILGPPSRSFCKVLRSFLAFLRRVFMVSWKCGPRFLRSFLQNLDASY